MGEMLFEGAKVGLSGEKDSPVARLKTLHYEKNQGKNASTQSVGWRRVEGYFMGNHFSLISR
jgi:hypothetical protein